MSTPWSRERPLTAAYGATSIRARLGDGRVPKEAVWWRTLLNPYEEPQNRDRDHTSVRRLRRAGFTSAVSRFMSCFRTILAF
jgi:hypothetical protein